MILSQTPIKKNFRQYLFSFFLIYLFIWVISDPILYTQFKRKLVQSIGESNQQVPDQVSESIEALLEKLSSLFLYLAISVEIEEFPVYFQNRDIIMMDKTLEDIQYIGILYGDQLSITVYFRRPEIVFTNEVLLRLPYHQFVFTLPKALRPFFRHDRRLFAGVRSRSAQLTIYSVTLCGRGVSVSRRKPD